MARSRDEILRDIEKDEAKIAALQDRAALLGTQAWLRYRQGFIKDLQECEGDLLRATDVSLSDRAQGIRLGKRAIIVAMLFTHEEVQEGMHALQMHAQGLRQELAAWEDRNWSPEPGR